MIGIILTIEPLVSRVDVVKNGVVQKDAAAVETNPEDALACAYKWRRENTSKHLDFITAYVPFTGDAFSGPIRVNDSVMEKLDALCLQAPAHIPSTCAAIRAAQTVLPPGTPVILVSGTAFFARLPRRESAYGLPPDLMHRLRLQRTGYHGLFHEAAYHHARRCFRSAEGQTPMRILSLCLDSKPELAAIFNGRPVMVTGGATPLEGLPGETTCGEIDASLALTLVEKAGMGPQHIGTLLAQESGLKGLTGRTCTFPDLFRSKTPESLAAREIFCYRLLLACGAGIAALSGVEGIAFSGRYAGLANEIGTDLVEKLERAMRNQQTPLRWTVFKESIAKLIADKAQAALRIA